MTKSMDRGRRYVGPLLVAFALAPLGCGDSAPAGPPPGSEEFKKAETERMDIIHREYGPELPAKKTRK